MASSPVASCRHLHPSHLGPREALEACHGPQVLAKAVLPHLEHLQRLRSSDWLRAFTLESHIFLQILLTSPSPPPPPTLSLAEAHLQGAPGSAAATVLTVGY